MHTNLGHPANPLFVRILRAAQVKAEVLNYVKTEFQCPDCGKGFWGQKDLESHQMNIHLKLRPYRCRYGCKDSYNDTSNRNSHEKKKHGKLFTTAREEKEKKLREECASSI